MVSVLTDPIPHSKQKFEIASIYTLNQTIEWDCLVLKNQGWNHSIVYFLKIKHMISAGCLLHQVDIGVWPMSNLFYQTHALCTTEYFLETLIYKLLTLCFMLTMNRRAFRSKREGPSN